jgi:hypothetical protein
MNLTRRSLFLSTALIPAALPAAEPSEAQKAAIAKIEAAGASARPLAQNDDRLEVDYHLAGSTVTDEHLAPLAELANVVRLNLGNTGITDAGLKHVAGLTSLTSLHLENTRIGDAALAHLKGLAELTYLNIYNTPVTDGGLAHLKPLKKLEKLFVWQTKVTEAGVKDLQKALPNVKIDTGWKLEDIEPPKKEDETEEKKPDAN